MSLECYTDLCPGRVRSSESSNLPGLSSNSTVHRMQHLLRDPRKLINSILVIRLAVGQIEPLGNTHISD